MKFPKKRQESEKLSAWEQIRRSKQSYLLIAPFMILFFFLTVIPMVASVGLSFTSFNMMQKPILVGWENYQRMLLDDPVFFKVLKNTLLFAFLTGPISYLLSFVKFMTL